MPSTRTWLVVLLALVGLVVASGVALSVLFSRAEAAGGLPSLSVVMPLRILAMLGIVAAIACVPPLVVRSFVGATAPRRHGRRAARRVGRATRGAGGRRAVARVGGGAAGRPAGDRREMKRAGFTSLVPPADEVTPLAPGVTRRSPPPPPARPSAPRCSTRCARASARRAASRWTTCAPPAPWAFLRATEVVPLDGGEEQETTSPSPRCCRGRPPARGR
jgi:hypothetical protein